jgi:hypothetical protein
MQLLKRLNLKPSEIVLNLTIVLILGISALFSTGLVELEYTILNMACIAWCFSCLDTATSEEDKPFYHYWVFMTLVMWVIMIFGGLLYLTSKGSELVKRLGEWMDDRFNR